MDFGYVRRGYKSNSLSTVYLMCTRVLDNDYTRYVRSDMDCILSTMYLYTTHVHN